MAYFRHAKLGAKIAANSQTFGRCASTTHKLVLVFAQCSERPDRAVASVQLFTQTSKF